MIRGARRKKGGREEGPAMEEINGGNYEEFIYEIFGELYTLPYLAGGDKAKERILVDATILFLKRGYSSISLHDVAATVGVSVAAVQEFYPNKDMLWDDVLVHARRLYVLYYRALDEELKKARTFREILKTMLHEPQKMSNVFACYAFSVIKEEQFQDAEAANIFIQDIMRYGINFFKGWFDRCVEMRFVEKFDTETMAIVIMNDVFMGIDMTVQRLLGRTSIPYSAPDHFKKLETLLLASVRIPPTM